jgi:hypothetical protein
MVISESDKIVEVWNMSIVRWNPSRELDQFFNRFVDQGFNGWGENIATSDWNPAVDIRETDEDYQIDLEVPASAAVGREGHIQGRRARRQRRTQIRKGNHR